MYSTLPPLVIQHHIASMAYLTFPSQHTSVFFSLPLPCPAQSNTPVFSSCIHRDLTARRPILHSMLVELLTEEVHHHHYLVRITNCTAPHASTSSSGSHSIELNLHHTARQLWDAIEADANHPIAPGTKAVTSRITHNGTDMQPNEHTSCRGLRDGDELVVEVRWMFDFITAPVAICVIL